MQNTRGFGQELLNYKQICEKKGTKCWFCPFFFLLYNINTGYELCFGRENINSVPTPSVLITFIFSP